MSAIITMTRPELEALVSKMLDERLGASTNIPDVSKVSKKAVKAEKKPRANAGKSTLTGAWTKHMKENHGPATAEYKAFVSKRVADAESGLLVYTGEEAKVKNGEKAIGDKRDAKDALVGVHIAFGGFWKKENPSEYATFKARWETEHSNGSSASSVAGPSDEEAEPVEAEVKPTKRRGAKKYSEMSPEELATTKAKRASKKAMKVAEEKVERAASIMAPAGQATSAEEADDSLIPFLGPKGLKCLRYGHLDSAGQGVWDEGGDLWEQAANGSKGDYLGILRLDGTIDSSPEVLGNEPLIS